MHKLKVLKLLSRLREPRWICSGPTTDKRTLLHQESAWVCGGPQRTEVRPYFCRIFLSLQSRLLNGRTSVCCGPAADLLGSARTSGGPLADPPGVLFVRTLADLLRTPKESAADPKIRGGFAADPPQVRGGAVDFLVSKKTEKVRQSAK